MIIGVKELRPICGIYIVINLINGHKYVGQSKNIQKRFTNHHCVDYLNPKNCCYNTKFYRALRKYGLDHFIVAVLEECKVEELDKKEIQYIQQYDSFKNGYNSTRGGQD